MSLGDRIRERRTQLEWTQDALAQKAGISKGFLSDLENDKRNISADTLLDIARVLGLSLDYLMTGEDGDASIKNVVEIPAGLAALGQKEGLSFPKMLTLLQMRRQIVAHRSTEKKLATDDFNWQKFYQSVKTFLK
jgi:transcriptional regulator with XRE-family HTH domain